ncbi:MAG: WbqC family protein [Saprospiraceae bacterium]
MTLVPNILLEVQYLPPVQYFSKLLHYHTIYIEAHEHYAKGSYRNRCHIAGANGLLRLSIPLEKGKNEQQSIREVRIAYEEPWQHWHWEGIQSAYGKSPFFEHYADAIAPFYEQRYTYLFDWNWDLLQTMTQLLGIRPDLQLTTRYEKTPGTDVLDFRTAISPKAHRQQDDPHFQPIRYEQVFIEKHGFLPNLSILDLLFCTGPEAISILHETFIKD